jgi:hypothetical protein
MSLSYTLLQVSQSAFYLAAAFGILSWIAVQVRRNTRKNKQEKQQ